MAFKYGGENTQRRKHPCNGVTGKGYSLNALGLIISLLDCNLG